MTPWTNAASYIERPIISTHADQQGEVYLSIINELLGNPVSNDPPMSLSSKLVLLACAFAVGCMIGLA